VDVTIQKTQRSIVNFKSVGTIMLETLSSGLNLPILDVCWAPFLVVVISLIFFFF